MPKLNNVQVCLECEELYVGDYCPKCCSRNFFYLRKYFEPLQRFGGHYEPVTVRKYNQIPEDLRSIQSDTLVTAINNDADSNNREFGYIQDIQTNAFHAGYECGKQAGDRSQPRESGYQRGKLLEAICTLLKGGYWSNASSSSNMGPSVDKRRTEESGDEPDRRNDNLKEIYDGERDTKPSPP